MSRFVEVAVNVPQVTEVFHYHLPAHLEGLVEVGHLVVVPFGKQTVQGVVLRFIERAAVPETLPVQELVDPQAVLTPAQIALAKHLSESTLAPLSACIRLMLPSGLTQMADTLYALPTKEEAAQRGKVTPVWGNLNPTQHRLMELLRRRGALRGRQIDQALPHRNWRPAMRSLVRRGLVSAQSVLPPPSVRPKAVRTVQLACPPQVAKAELPHLGRPGSAALQRRQAVVRFLLREAKAVEVSWVYAESGANLADLHYLAERGLVVLGENPIWRDPLSEMSFVPTQPPTLTRAQQAAWEDIQRGIERALQGQPVAPFLLHGVTGSGKTEIYLRAVEKVLQSGRQAIVLVPEIALTPQTVQRFVARFPGQVGMVHSRLSEGERYDTWRRARLGKLAVVIGPRSALFMPFPNLGLIVVDECHDDSYYQSEGVPYYHAREAAVVYASLCGAVCLLGSATPDLVSQYRAKQGEWQILRLPDRILAHRQAVQNQLRHIAEEKSLAPPYQGEAAISAEATPPSVYRSLEGQAQVCDLPPVHVVDMRQELRSGNRSIFSRALQVALAQVLQSGQQAILFLNRRGTATYVFCRDCGHSLRCPRCTVPLTYHLREAGTGAQANTPLLVCHHCGYQRQMPKTCPNCKSTRIRHYGMGTERVEAEVQSLFPQARTLRWDYETTQRKGAHEFILNRFAAHHADVLIGTQMLAKGLDLPLVTLVGVILADVGLNLPDVRAAERVFQVLMQVAGRAGRSPLGGQVILQTFQPDHYVIRAAAKHDYEAFYNQELEYRRQLGYPPFAQLVRLEYRHLNAERAEAAARAMASQVRTWLEREGRRATQMIGPVPCFFTRLQGTYRWQIILRGPDPASLLRDRPLGEWRVEVNPPSLL
jgi:primosomal protein N' (replication factor Y)